MSSKTVSIIFLYAAIDSLSAICNNYYQASGPSSTKRPFDLCYHSEIIDGIRSSYRYICILSTTNEYGNNSVGGYTAFREDFDTIDCEGSPVQTRIVVEPYKILCELQSPQCDILRYRQYPVINAAECTYNQSTYAEDINVLDICDDNGAESEAIFCAGDASTTDVTPYFWTNKYYGGTCDNDQLFEASYQFNGCQGDGETYLEILACDSDDTPSGSSSSSSGSTSGCGNYWQSDNDGASSSRRPMDVCYRSYHYTDSSLDYSYRYICSTSILNENYTANGYSVFTQYYNGVGCEGEPNATLLTSIVPYAIYCGGDDCDIVRYRIYEIDPTDDTTGQCDDPDAIKELNAYQERLHVIQRCDDDGSVSDSYFCANEYFYINSYNNDECINDGIYASQYYFEGCNDNDEYIEVVGCDNPPTGAPTANPSASPTANPTATDLSTTGTNSFTTTNPSTNGTAICEIPGYPGCISFYDGCNTCSCSNDLEVFCTEIACNSIGEQKCLVCREGYEGECTVGTAKANVLTTVIGAWFAFILFFTSM